MIDWFVILIPLILLPIFLLTVFVGCGLRREGQGPPEGTTNSTTVYFNYVAGLNNHVKNFVAKFGVKPEAAASGATKPPDIIRNGIEILATGESVPAGDIPLDSQGLIGCRVEGKNKMDEDFYVQQVDKDKAKDDIAPTFTLEPDGPQGFKIT